MLNSEVEEKLRQIKIENYIWIIYLIIIGISYYSNYLEKDYFVNNNIESKKKYRETLIIIFSILLIIYLYFTVDAYKSIETLKENDSKEKKDLVTLSFIGSLLILISGIIFLYVAYKDYNLDVELAFN